MKRTYKVVTKPSTLSSRELAEFLSKDGQLLLPRRALGAGREGHRRGGVGGLVQHAAVAGTDWRRAAGGV